MAKIQNAANSTEESIGIAMSRTELFFEKNGKALTLGLIVLVLLGGLWVGYRNLVSKPRHEKAAELLAQAQNKFEADDADYTVALNGDDNGAGFLEVIERYGSTPAGNLAKHYAGICYLKEGDLKNAAAYLAKYTPVKGIPGSVVNAQNYGLQGDIAVDEGNYKEAVRFFEKAVEAADNNATPPRRKSASSVSRPPIRAPSKRATSKNTSTVSNERWQPSTATCRNSTPRCRRPKR